MAATVLVPPADILGPFETKLTTAAALALCLLGVAVGACLAAALVPSGSTGSQTCIKALAAVHRVLDRGKSSPEKEFVGTDCHKRKADPFHAAPRSGCATLSANFGSKEALQSR